MQRYKILHRTYYNFSNPVKLGLHYLRIRPREDYELHVESSKLNITPAANLLWHREAEGNSVAIASFELPTTQLIIESEVVIQQFNEAPLDFLVADYAVDYPFSYQVDDRTLLSPYMQLPEDQTRAQLMYWLQDIWQAGDSIQTYTLLNKLALHINHSLSYCIREEPGVQTAQETLNKGTGSCRDFAVLFMQTARCLGLASRFVSGYLYSAPSATDYGATHAWAEVYLPGAGWKGFDPTSGEIVGSDHIAVAVARLPESVPPVAGSFYGNAESKLEVGVWVSKC